MNPYKWSLLVVNGKTEWEHWNDTTREGCRTAAKRLRAESTPRKLHLRIRKVVECDACTSCMTNKKS